MQMWNACLSIWLESPYHFTRTLLFGILTQQEYSQLPGGIKETYLNKTAVMEVLHQSLCTFSGDPHLLSLSLLVQTYFWRHGSKLTQTHLYSLLYFI